MIDIYGTSACNWCNAAKELCEGFGLNYQYYEVDKRPEDLEVLERILGKRVRTVPQIFIDGVHIGGYSEFKEKVNPDG